MKATIKLLIVWILTLLVSAWLAPFLFVILPFEFERILTRLIMLIAMTAIYVLYLRGREAEMLLAGLAGASKRRHFSLGFAFGVAMLVFIVILEVLLGTRIVQVNFPVIKIPYRLGQALATGLSIGIFEEWFFRGFLLKSFCRVLPLGESIFWTNVVYALSHYVDVGNLKGGAGPSFLNALKLIAGFYSPHSDLWVVLMGCVGLVIFGYILTYALIRTGSLYVSMGLHAGLVTALKLQGRFVEPAYPGWHWFFGDRKYYNGVLGWICLLLFGYLLILTIKKLSWPKADLRLHEERV